MSRLTVTFTLVEVLLTTVATLVSPEPKVRCGKLSTTWPASITERVNGDGSVSGAPAGGSSELIRTLSSASGLTLSTVSGVPSERSAAASCSVAGWPAGSAFGIRQM